MTHQILRLPEVVNRTGVPRSTLYAKVAEGEFPTPIKLGQRSVGWSAAEVEAWIADRIEERHSIPAHRNASIYDDHEHKPHE